MVAVVGVGTTMLADMLGCRSCGCAAGDERVAGQGAMAMAIDAAVRGGGGGLSSRLINGAVRLVSIGGGTAVRERARSRGET